jgi:hypothetical protein
MLEGGYTGWKGGKVPHWEDVEAPWGCRCVPAYLEQMESPAKMEDTQYLGSFPTAHVLL